MVDFAVIIKALETVGVPDISGLSGMLLT